MSLVSYPGHSKIGEKGLVSTVCLIPPCAVTFVRVHCRIFIRTLLTMAVCMEDLEVLYALLQLESKATALKLEKKHQ